MHPRGLQHPLFRDNMAHFPLSQPSASRLGTDDEEEEDEEEEDEEDEEEDESMDFEIGSTGRPARAAAAGRAPSNGYATTPPSVAVPPGAPRRAAPGRLVRGAAVQGQGQTREQPRDRGREQTREVSRDQSRELARAGRGGGVASGSGRRQ